MKLFEKQIKKHFTEKKQTIIEETEKMMEILQDGESDKNTIIFHLGFYQNMKLKTDFKHLRKKLKSMFKSLKN